MMIPMMLKMIVLSPTIHRDRTLMNEVVHALFDLVYSSRSSFFLVADEKNSSLCSKGDTGPKIIKNIDNDFS